MLYGSIWHLSFCLKEGGFSGEDFYDTIWITVRFYGQ